MKNQELVYFVYNRYFKSDFQYKEDLIQEGFISLLRAEEMFDPNKGEFSTFAFKVIKNGMLMFLRKEKKLTHYLLDGKMVEYKSYNDLSGEGEVFDIIGQEDAYRISDKKLLKALSELKEQQRKTIIDVYYGDKTITEISKEEDKTVQCISIRVQRGLRKLKNKLQREDFSL